MKNILSILVLLLFVALCSTSHLQAASQPPYAGGVLVQGAAPDPRAGYSAKITVDTVGYFPVEGKIWFELFNPTKDITFWILSSQDRTTGTAFTLPAGERLSYNVNPTTTFVGYSSGNGLQIKSE